MVMSGVYSMKMETIPIGSIRISDLNIRANEPFGDEEDEEFVKNIEALGILEPIIVRPVGKFFHVDVGRRRFLSAQQLGYTELDCIVREASDVEAMDASISENVFRRNVDPVTLGLWIKMRLAKGDISLSQYAKRIGKAKSTLSEWLRMTDLTIEMQEQVKAQAVPFTYALKVARMNLSPAEEKALALEAATGGFDAFKDKIDGIAAIKEKRGAPKGLLIVRMSFGQTSRDYNKLKRLAEKEGVDLTDYCMNVLKAHAKKTKA